MPESAASELLEEGALPIAKEQENTVDCGGEPVKNFPRVRIRT